MEMSDHSPSDNEVRDESEEESDWEEVQVEDPQLIEGENEHVGFSVTVADAPPRANIEITLPTNSKKDKTKKKALGISHEERTIRTQCHKIHTVLLLANARVRNRWLNDELLHARLTSLTPLSLQNSFAMIHKSRVPDQHKRGRLFESAINRLVEWWAGTFFTVLPSGHIKNRIFDDVQNELSDVASGRKSVGLYGDDEVEIIRSEKSLMKHALMQSGSRDTSAQLFTALCRALDIPARLVVSLQSVPWQSGAGKPKATYRKSKSRSKAKGSDTENLNANEKSQDEDDDGDMEQVDIPDFSKLKGKGKAKAQDIDEDENELSRRASTRLKEVADRVQATEKTKPEIKLRKSKSQVRRLSDTGPPSDDYDPTASPPVFWTEVFSRADSRWLPVDPIRGIVNKRKIFDPSLSSTATGRASRQENRMLYVIAVEEDGYGRDVTPRYARDYTTKVAKVQGVGVGGGGRGRKEWWEQVVRMITRPYRLQRDDLEDDEFQNNQLTEGMPTTIAGFKDHPLYALARHLRREEIIDPPTELGKFRGEPVYPRSSVISLKTAENWMRQGRKIREGCQPLKMVKQRAVTVSRKRELELALERARAEGQAEEEDAVLQGLYAKHQTELYQPQPIVDGKIPKNDFGNIDLYVPSMLPRGAVHVPYKGVAKIARKLGFDYAEAVTGFEFKKRRAFPILEGIVVAAENEAVIVEAYWESEQAAESKMRAKRREQVLKRWSRLVQGLRIRRRLQAQYAQQTPQDESSAQAHDQVTKETASDVGVMNDEQGDLYGAGGYLTTADDIVQPFKLPKSQHPVLMNADLSSGASESKHHNQTAVVTTSAIDVDLIESVEGDARSDSDVIVLSDVQPTINAPKTMRQLADEHAARGQQDHEDENEDDTPVNGNGHEEEKMSVFTSAMGGGSSSVALENGARGRGRGSHSGGAMPNGRGARTPQNQKRKRARADSADNADSVDKVFSPSIEQEGEDRLPSAKRRRSAPGRKIRLQGGDGAELAPSIGFVTPSTRVLRSRVRKVVNVEGEGEVD